MGKWGHQTLEVLQKKLGTWGHGDIKHLRFSTRIWDVGTWGHQALEVLHQDMGCRDMGTSST